MAKFDHLKKSMGDFYLKNKNLEIKKTLKNPANAPKLRPIEDFWGILKQKVNEKGWSAKSINQLKKKISESLKKIDPKVSPQLADTVFTRVDKCRRYGYDVL